MKHLEEGLKKEALARKKRLPHNCARAKGLKKKEVRKGYRHQEKRDYTEIPKRRKETSGQALKYSKGKKINSNTTKRNSNQAKETPLLLGTLFCSLWGFGSVQGGGEAEWKRGQFSGFLVGRSDFVFVCVYCMVGACSGDVENTNGPTLKTKGKC